MRMGIKNKPDKAICEVQAPLEPLEHIITQAENDELVPNLSSFDTLEFLKEIRSYYKTSHVLQDEWIELDSTSQGLHMISDRKLLTHVIRELIVNAAEASPMGQEVVHVGCFAELDHCTFWVFNEAVMPDFVQTRVFDRGFSAKSQTRGLGTYAIKLLSEQYLKGSVAFTSKTDEGTIFKVTLPLKLTH